MYMNIKYKHCFSFWALVLEMEGFTWVVNIRTYIRGNDEAAS